MPEDQADIRVLIVDDHRMFAESLAHLLDDEDDIAVLGVAESASEAVAMAKQTEPDVVLVDYQMPGTNGIEVTRQLKALGLHLRVVMLTGFDDDRILVSAIEAGCSGFLTKDRAAAEVGDAVRAVAAGEALISPAMLARLLPRISRSPRALGKDLTARELEVLGRLARGSTNKVIAADMYLSVNTVRNYVQSVLTKLEAHSKLEAVANAVSAGIIAYPSD